MQMLLPNEAQTLYTSNHQSELKVEINCLDSLNGLFLLFIKFPPINFPSSFLQMAQEKDIPDRMNVTRIILLCTIRWHQQDKGFSGGRRHPHSPQARR
jgi:hypothetical protein